MNTCASQNAGTEQVDVVLMCREESLLRVDGDAAAVLCGAAAMWLTLHCTALCPDILTAKH